MEPEVKEKKVKKIKLENIIIGIVAVLIIIGFGIYYYLNIFNKTEEKNPNQETTTTKIIEEKKVQIVNLESKTRPYAVMINNIGTARSLQSGLQDAFIIYEIIVEAGITRYLALFQDVNVERIGSVRSVRHYYLDYVLENDAFLAHNGQSPQAGSDFSRLGIDRIEVNNTKTGWRDKTLKVSSEHTLFTSTEKLATGSGNKRTERNKDYLLKYSVEPVDFSTKENVIDAKNVSVEYSSTITSSYEYDEEAKVYKRFVNGKIHKDYVTGNQYTFKNIIVYDVANYNLNDAENKGRQGIDNIGSGKGYYISEGKAVPITWSKTSRSAQTIYKFENGEKLIVNDGNTFIQIQPKIKKLTIN
jgi:hypothetical protein